MVSLFKTISVEKEKPEDKNVKSNDLKDAQHFIC